MFRLPLRIFRWHVFHERNLIKGHAFYVLLHILPACFAASILHALLFQVNVVERIWPLNVPMFVQTALTDGRTSTFNKACIVLIIKTSAQQRRASVKRRGSRFYQHY